MSSSGSPGLALTPSATVAVAAAGPKASLPAANGTSPQLAQATAPTVASGTPRSPAGMQKAAPAPTADNGLSTLNRVGSANALFPSLSAALAPIAAPASNPYNTLSPGTDISKLSAMVVELLLTGQNLYPFSAADQYAIATTVNNLISPYPHIVELSNIGVSSRQLSCFCGLQTSNCCKYYLFCAVYILHGSPAKIVSVILEN